MKKFLLLSTLVLLAVLIAGCGPSGPSAPKGNPTLSLIMTDAPPSIEGLTEVHIIVTSVVLTPSGAEGDESSSVTIPTDISDIELLGAKDNPLTFLESAEIPPGTYGQLRLIVDESQCYVVVDGVQHPLTTPSAEQSGFKILLQDYAFEEGGAYSVTLDFDVNSSVVHETGSGKYMLHPTIKATLTNVAGWVTGTVVDSDSNPLSGASVTLTNTGDATKKYDTYTDDTGNFRINGVIEGDYDVAISLAGYVDYTGSATVTAEQETALGTITLNASPGSVTGTVVDAGSNPLSGASITLTDGTSTYTASSGADGTFTISDVPAGTYDIEVSLAGYDTYTGTGSVTVTAGQETALGAITLNASPGSVSGTVEDAGSNPLSGASITLTDGTSTYTATSGADGTFAISDVPAGTYDIEVSLAGYDTYTGTGSVTVTAGQETALGTITLTATP